MIDLTAITVSGFNYLAGEPHWILHIPFVDEDRDKSVMMKQVELNAYVSELASLRSQLSESIAERDREWGVALCAIGVACLAESVRHGKIEVSHEDESPAQQLQQMKEQMETIRHQERERAARKAEVSGTPFCDCGERIAAAIRES